MHNSEYHNIASEQDKKIGTLSPGLLKAKLPALASSTHPVELEAESRQTAGFPIQLYMRGGQLPISLASFKTTDQETPPVKKQLASHLSSPWGTSNRPALTRILSREYPQSRNRVLG